MSPDYDTSDPLQLLMAEWTQAGRWFWVFLGASALALLLLPRFPNLALLIAGAGFGQVLLRFGSTVIVATNELRKELRSAGGMGREE